MIKQRKPLSLYVHIPFCKAKCTYCDFFSVVGKESVIPGFLDMIIDEIEGRALALDLSGYHIDTIFFGGGTPNLLLPVQVGQIVDALLKMAQAGENLEIGMEINPGEANLETLRDYRSLGVNRVSIGIQSFQPNLLRFMSRIHTAEKSISTYEDVRQAGFTNVSADLIFAIPGQTRKQWAMDLEQLVDMAPDHISTYSLTVEENTALYRWVNAGHVRMLEESVDTGMYELGRDYLELKGYNNYEISNYAQSGFKCRHNLNYWTGVDYLGFGPAAHSFFKGHRSWNVSNLDLYLSRIHESSRAVEVSEIIGDVTARNEMILTRLRLASGLNLGEYTQVFKEDLRALKRDILKKWAGQLIVRDEHLIVTRSGWPLIDEISSDLMFLESPEDDYSDRMDLLSNGVKTSSDSRGQQ